MTNLYERFLGIGCWGGLLALGLGLPLASQAQYTAGNIVVLRVGESGSGSLTNASAPVSLDEYTPTGGLRNSLLLNNADPGNKLTNTGNGTSEGFLTLAANGQYLVTAGYNTAVGLANVNTSSAATVPRTVARISANRVVDISTSLTDAFSGGNIRGAATVDGSSFFLSGVGSSSGVRMAALGATASTSGTTTVANARAVRIARGQVYFSVGTGTTPGIYLLGPATSTTSQVATPFLVTGNGASSASPYGFVLLDRDPAVPGLDAAYVADDGSGAATAGIQKWAFDGTAWTLADILPTSVRGLTGGLAPNGSVVLYATTRSAASGNTVITVTDTNGSRALFSNATPTVIVPASPNVAYRGVEFAPGTAVALPVALTSFGASRAGAGVQLRWATASELHSSYFEVERSFDGRAFTSVARVAAAGSAALPRAYTAHDAAAPPSTLYYRLRQVDQDGTAAYSPTSTVAAGPAGLAAYPNPAQDMLTIALAAGAATAHTAELRDLRGVLRRTITLPGSGQLSLAGLPAGTYLLQVDGGPPQRIVRM